MKILKTKPEHHKILTVPEPVKVEFVNRPYPRVKPGSLLVKTEIAAVCVDDRMYTDHINDSQSGWAAMAEYRLADEGICTLLAPDLDLRKEVCACV